MFPKVKKPSRTDTLARLQAASDALVQSDDTIDHAFALLEGAASDPEATLQAQAALRALLTCDAFLTSAPADVAAIDPDTGGLVKRDLA